MLGLLALASCAGCKGLSTPQDVATIRANDSTAIDIESTEPEPDRALHSESFGGAALPVESDRDGTSDEQASTRIDQAKASTVWAWFMNGAVADWWDVEPNFNDDWSEERPWPALWADQRNFYSRENLPSLIGGLTVAAILANSSADSEVADWYQSQVRNGFTDDVSALAEPFGEQWPMMSLYLAASLIGRTGYASPQAQEWGERSLRSMLVGVPPLLLGQKLIGSSRPGETDSSDWSFWNDTNGVSGHAFVGAVPFLIAGQLSESSQAKIFWTIASTLPAWSRVNDNNHYLSQAILGWWLAQTVTRGIIPQSNSSNMRIQPWSDGERVGVGFEMRR